MAFMHHLHNSGKSSGHRPYTALQSAHGDSCTHESQYFTTSKKLALRVSSNYLCFYLTWAALALPLSAGCLPEVFSSPRFLLLSYESCIPQIDAALPYPGRLQGQTAAGGGRNEASLIPPVNLCLLPQLPEGYRKVAKNFAPISVWIKRFVLYLCFL